MAEFQIDETVDITDVVCPVTFVKAKVALEELDDGQILSIRMNDGEPVQNVPRSIKEEGHKILKLLQNEDGTYNKIENYENVGTSSDNTHGNVHLEKGETKTITLYYLITDEEFENETLAIDFYIEGSPCKGTLAIIHEPETN